VEGEAATVALSSGAEISSTFPSGTKPQGPVTVVIRPEHAQTVEPGAGLLSGTVSNVVYLGTDTHIHLTLDDGTPFVVRQQNARSGRSPQQAGDKVGIAISSGVAQILKD
jgi:spermidine/putrescine transport system ATP-binding protein